MLRRKKPFGIQLCFQLFKGSLQITCPGRHHRIDIKLYLPVPRIERDPPDSQNLHAVIRAETQQPRIALEKNAAQRAFGILQRKVSMPGRIELKI